jgi:predicted metal-dependent phosphoesterase TrpH
MSASLAQVGILGAFEGALKYAGNPDLISRTHFARHLVKTGVCREPNEVFRRYLTPGKPGFVPHQWATLAEAVDWIRRAGGVAVLAHPGRYPLTAMQEYALLSDFKALGGLGIEVITGSHTPAEFIQYAQVARDVGLAASCGSDFHAPGESRIDLGTLPPMPADLPKVWDLLERRIHRHTT